METEGQRILYPRSKYPLYAHTLLRSIEKTAIQGTFGGFLVKFSLFFLLWNQNDNKIVNHRKIRDINIYNIYIYI